MPYDAAAKELFDTDPAGWAALLGVTAPPECIRRLDSELSTTAAADRVLRIDTDPPFVLDVEFQSTRDPGVPRQLLRYFAALHDKYNLPVRSVLVVLAPSADAEAYSGQYAVELGGRRAIDFRYDVVRVWELPHDRLLAGPLATLPLAPIADVPPGEVVRVLKRAAVRFQTEAAPGAASHMVAALGFLLRRRYGPVLTDEFYDQYLLIDNEEDSLSTFIKKRFAERRAEGKAEGLAEGLAEGKAQGLAEAKAEAVERSRGLLLRRGTKKFGPPAPDQAAAVAALTDLAALDALADRLFDVSTWDELLAPPGP